MENKVNLDIQTLEKGRKLALKIFVETYLMLKGENTDNFYPNREITEETPITGHETQVLHYWLVDEFKRMGLDLNKVIEIHGEEATGKELSKYEIEELMRRADALLIQMGIAKKYYDANHQ